VEINRLLHIAEVLIRELLAEQISIAREN